MFGLGVGELLLVGAVGLLFFGPKKLPELGSSLGKAITNFKKGLNDIGEENRHQNQGQLDGKNSQVALDLDEKNKNNHEV